jgi:two-component system response regulator YesN
MSDEKDMLLKVLLVDDEPFIRKGLAALIDWEAEGFVIAGEAQNGCEAVLRLSEEDYQLVISDIRMPDMSGIELVEEVKTRKISEAKFVLLSGFYDFQYAKSAILYGCSDYVLKPIQREELLNVLRRIQKKIREEAGGRRDKSIFEKAYLDRNLLALIWGKYDEINLRYAKEKLELKGRIKYIHLEISLLDERFLSQSEEKKRVLHRQLYNYAALLFKRLSNHVIFGVTKEGECYDIGIIYSELMPDKKNMTDEEWLDWVLKELRERMGFEITAFLGGWVSKLEDIAYSYREAAMARSFCFYKTPKKDIKKEPAQGTGKKTIQNKNQQDEYLRKELDALIHGIETGDKEFIKENSGELYRKMMDKGLDSKLIGMNIQYYVYRLLGLAYEIENDINQEEVMQYIQEEVFSSGMPWINEVKFRKFAEDYSEYLLQLRQNSARGIMNLIEAEIEANYSDNLSLRSMGEKYYLNSVYLGQIFKKRYGCCFKDYINGVRLRKAAELLLRTEEKVYEIAEKVGYKNTEYFINKFESTYGVTPARFRKRNCEAEKISV